MENLQDQIFKATDSFLTTIRALTQRHAEAIFQETFSAMGNAGSPKNGTKSAGAVTKQRGAKRDPEELEQLSQSFAQFVHANPGLRIEQINKQLSTTTKDLALPIRKLIASGVITVKGQKRSTAYFPGKNAPASTEENGKNPNGAESSPETPTKKSRKKGTSAKKGRNGGKNKGKGKPKSKR